MGRGRLPPPLRADINAYLANLAAKRSRIATRRANLQQLDTPWVKSVKAKVRQASRGRLLLEPDQFASIISVPDHMRRDDPAAYEPSVVAVGPLHHGRCLEVIEDYKWRSVRHLLARHQNGEWASCLLDDCLAEMKLLESKVRSCYAGKVFDLGPDQFAEMLLLDGCFLLYVLLRQSKVTAPPAVRIVVDEAYDSDDLGWGSDSPDYILETANRSLMRESYSYRNGDSDGELLEEGDGEEVRIAGNLWIWTLVKYDLLKLENQIPFFVVEALFDVLRTTQDREVDLVKLALELFDDIHPRRADTRPQVPSNAIHHLLHLFHLALLPPELAWSLPSAELTLPDAMLPEWIPSVTELQNAGVHFRRKADASSFLGVEFGRGVMEIPPLNIYKYSNSIFRNLVAFEQCFPVQPHITNYSLFMNCILRTAEDVRLLHLNGIVLNGQKSDEEVAALFRRLCGGVHYACDTNYLRGLFVEVRRYHESKWNSWWAGLMRDYFSNPWIIMSVVAAVFLLLLTVEQAFFAAYAYFRPPG